MSKPLEPLLNKLMRLVNTWEFIYIPAKKTEMRNLTEADQARLLVAWMQPYVQSDQGEVLPLAPAQREQPAPVPEPKKKIFMRSNKEGKK